MDHLSRTIALAIALLRSATKALHWSVVLRHMGQRYLSCSMTLTTESATLRFLFDAQYKASRLQIDVPLTLRHDRLLRMRTLINDHGSALAQAVEADFGVRSEQLTELADLFVLRTLMSHTLKSLAKWMKPVKVGTPLYLQPAHAYLQRQPLGVVGVVSPWNYPVQLALGPVITALAAGNRVMLKPSELTPLTSALMARLIEKTFAPDELCVVQGDGALAAEFSSLPFGRQSGRSQSDANYAGARRQVALHHRRFVRPE